MEKVFNKEGNSLTRISFDYYSLIFGFIIFLFTSMECLINSNIPKKVKRQNKDGKFDDYDFILRNYTFEDKIKKVLNKEFEKNFTGENSNEWQIVCNLKKLRDELIHIKPEVKNELDHESIIKRCIQLDFERILDAVKSFINFYEPNLLEDVT